MYCLGNWRWAVPGSDLLCIRLKILWVPGEAWTTNAHVRDGSKLDATVLRTIGQNLARDGEPILSESLSLWNESYPYSGDASTLTSQDITLTGEKCEARLFPIRGKFWAFIPSVSCTIHGQNGGNDERADRDIEADQILAWAKNHQELNIF